ncbi:helix-turn-helix domain-containing protein, partial [Pseudomonas amygdali]
SLDHYTMSLKTAFAAVLKAMRSTRGLSQKHLAKFSSRTYISKLERGQSSPTLEMITALSIPLELSPLTLMAVTISAETGHSLRSLVSRVEAELAELSKAGVLKELAITADEVATARRSGERAALRRSVDHIQQTEFCFVE